MAAWVVAGGLPSAPCPGSGSSTPSSSAVVPCGALERTEKAVSDVKVQQKQSLSRQEAARLIAALAEGLGEDGKVTVQLGNSTLELSVTDQVDWELEVEVDGDEIELELELKWSTSGRTSAGAVEDESEEDESEDVESEAPMPEPVSGEDDAEHPGTGRVAVTGDEAEDGESAQDVAEPDEADAMPAAEPEPSSESRRSRGSASAGAGKSASNGIDTAAVRAWAAANGLKVSPRGRIKDEVLEAYRAAGN
jgi:amphi-Trp domain-containing protein